jgi:hypothetical protein
VDAYGPNNITLYPMYTIEKPAGVWLLFEPRVEVPPPRPPPLCLASSLLPVMHSACIARRRRSAERAPRRQEAGLELFHVDVSTCYNASYQEIETMQREVSAPAGIG